VGTSVSSSEPRRRPRQTIWISLARGGFVTKTPDYEGWIFLDFLGFSRPNWNLSMGYAAFVAKLFSSRFCPWGECGGINICIWRPAKERLGAAGRDSYCV
jgi:hypothetical protein